MRITTSDRTELETELDRLEQRQLKRRKTALTSIQKKRREEREAEILAFETAVAADGGPLKPWEFERALARLWKQGLRRRTAMARVA